MKKIIISLLLLSNLLSASILLDKDYPLCIEDYYIKSGFLYYLRSSDNTWTSTSENQAVRELHPGYIWDADNEICKPNDATILGISEMDYNFLMALSGLLFGFGIFIVSSLIFIQVGTKK